MGPGRQHNANERSRETASREVTAESKRFGLWLLGIVLGGLAIRVVHLLDIRAHDPFFSNPSVDPSRYHAWARELSAGDWIGSGTFHLGPLYPYVLGGLYRLFGDSLECSRWLNIALGGLSIWLIGLLARRTFGWIEGLVAAALVSTYPMLIYVGGDILQENVQIPLNALMLIAWSAAQRDPRWHRMALAGACVGLSAWARANVLLFVPFAGVLFILSDRGRGTRLESFRSIAWFVLGVAMALAPITIRNMLVAGDAVLLTDNAGINFYIGNNPDASGFFRTPAWIPAAQFNDPDLMRSFARAHAEAAQGRVLRPSEVSAHWAGMAIEWMLSSPTDALRLWWTKAWLLLSCTEFGVERQIVIDQSFSWVLRWPLPGFMLIIPWTLLGCVLSVWNWERCASLVVFLGSQALALVLFFLSDRYRLPLAAGAFPLAAFSLVWLARCLRDGRWRPAAFAGAFVLMAGILTIRPEQPNATASNFFNLGNKFRDVGKSAVAITHYRTALGIDADNIGAWNNLALLLEADTTPESTDRAIEAWSEVWRIAVSTHDRVRQERASRHLQALGVVLDPEPARSR